MAAVAGEVVENEENAKKTFIVKCRARKLVTLMKDFNAVQKEALRRVGFGGLLDLSFKNYPLDSVHHFVEAFNDRSYVFRASPIKEFMLTKHDVHDCFLLPLGPNDLKLVATGPKKDENEEEVRIFKARWCSEFNIRKPGAPILLGKLANAIKADVEGGDKFIKLFVVYSMSAFLCPTLNSSVDLKLLSAVEDVSLISQYDWCSYVLDGLVEDIYQASKKARCLGGCIPFLMITYFHRFDFRGKSSPSDMPLIKHWSNKKLKERINGELVGGSLGRQTFSSVHYPRCLDPTYVPNQVHEHPPSPMVSAEGDNASRDESVPEVAAEENVNHVDEPVVQEMPDNEIPKSPININETDASKIFIQIRIPPGVDNDRTLHSKATDPLHALYLQMQRNSVAFHAWYSETASKIRALITNAFPVNDISPSQSTQAFFENPAVHRYVNDVVENARQMKVSSEHAPRLDDPSTSQVRQVLDDLQHETTDLHFGNDVGNCSADHTDSNAHENVVEGSDVVKGSLSASPEIQSDYAFDETPMPPNLYSTLEVEEVVREAHEQAVNKDGAIIPFEEQAVVDCDIATTVTPTTITSLTTTQSNDSNPTERELLPESSATTGKRPRRHEPNDKTSSGPRKVCRSLDSSSLYVIRSTSRGRGDGLGCTLHCGVVTEKAPLVSTFMKKNQKNTSSMPTLRRDVADYCFLDENTEDPNESEGLDSNSRAEKHGGVQSNLKLLNSEDEEEQTEEDLMNAENEAVETESSRGNATPSVSEASTSSTSKSCKGDSTTSKFEGFEIRSDLVPILEKIWREHGNIVENSTIRSGDIVAMALESLATMVQILEDNSDKSLSDCQAGYLNSTLSDLRCLRFKVDWLAEMAVNLQKSKDLVESLNKLSESSSRVKESKAVLLEEIAKLNTEESRLKAEMAKVSKMIPFSGQLNFDVPIGCGLD